MIDRFVVGLVGAVAVAAYFFSTVYPERRAEERREARRREIEETA